MSRLLCRLFGHDWKPIVAIDEWILPNAPVGREVLECRRCRKLAPEPPE